MILTIDTDELAKLAQHGTEFTMDTEAETSLARLLFLQGKIAEAINDVKTKIEEKALAMDSNFTGLTGDKLKIEYRAFGAEFAMPNPKAVDKEFRLEKTTYSIDTKRVKQYEADTGILPVGIERVERKKQISIKKV